MTFIVQVLLTIHYITAAAVARFSHLLCHQHVARTLWPFVVISYPISQQPAKEQSHETLKKMRAELHNGMVLKMDDKYSSL